MENQIKKNYITALKEIRNYCKSINQNYHESIEIMEDLTVTELKKQNIILSHTPLDRMKIFCSIWESIKTEI